MNRWIMLGVLAIILGAAFGSGFSAHALQCQDAAGGSVDCPDDSNPNEDDDAPSDIAAPERIPGDFDGDGTPDETDQCVEQSGPDWNNGCPTDLSAPPATQSPDPTAPSAPQDFTLPEMPPDGGCMVTPSSAEAVNVRALPMPGSQVLATIEAGQTYQVIQILNNEFGMWYRVLIPSGWVSGLAVVQGGDCSNVPTVSSGIIDLSGTEIHECPPTALCRFPFDMEIGDAPPPPEPPDVDFVCLENGVCIGTLTAPLPDPVCTTLSICCASPGLCNSLLIWTLPDSDDPGGNPTGQVISAYIPVGPDPLPEPEPFFLAGVGGDPTAQTREHILLARQVGMSTEDGVVPFELVIDTGDGDPVPVGLLLPAVQKVREAAGQMMPQGIILYGIPVDPEPPIDEALQSLTQGTDATEHSCHPGAVEKGTEVCECYSLSDCFDMVTAGVCNNAYGSACVPGYCFCIRPEQK